MATQDKHATLNQRLKEIMRSFPPSEMWVRGDEIVAIRNAIKGKNEYLKKQLIEKYQGNV